jgi:hypothetical protein
MSVKSRPQRVLGSAPTAPKELPVLAEIPQKSELTIGVNQASGCSFAPKGCFEKTTLGFVADSGNFFHKSSCQCLGKVL